MLLSHTLNLAKEPSGMGKLSIGAAFLFATLFSEGKLHKNDFMAALSKETVLYFKGTITLFPPFDLACASLASAKKLFCARDTMELSISNNANDNL